MPLEALVVWVMCSLRAIGVVLVLPAPGARALPAPLRGAIGLLLAGLLGGVVPRAPDLALVTWGPLATAAAGEVVVGLALGFVGRAFFAAAELGGRLIANEAGLVAAPGFDVPTPSQEPLPSFIGAFATLLFFGFGGHEIVLAAFARSFELAPAGAAALGPEAPGTFIAVSARVIELGLHLAAPFIALNFVITLAFAILSRAVPKMNVFIVSYALRTAAGLGLLLMAGELLARYLGAAVSDLPWDMLRMVSP